jgi:hypothetical protein
MFGGEYACRPSLYTSLVKRPDLIPAELDDGHPDGQDDGDDRERDEQVEHGGGAARARVKLEEYCVEQRQEDGRLVATGLGSSDMVMSHWR